jgi:hypothetical protein
MKKLIKKAMKEAHGYAFISPRTGVDYRIYRTITAAQDAAAFASERLYSHISMPSDWHRAYKQGFRIAKAAIKAGNSHKSWANYRGEDE